MAKQALTQRDLREMPAYGIAEAAGYLRLPLSTLRAWIGITSYRIDLRSPGNWQRLEFRQYWCTWALQETKAFLTPATPFGTKRIGKRFFAPMLPG